MLRSPHLAALAAAALTASACGDPEGDDDAATDDDSAPADDDTFSGDDDTEPSYIGSVSGTVADFAGEPLVDLPVTLCLDVCFFGSTDAAGRFTFSNLEPGHYKFDAIAPPSEGSTAFSNVLFPVDVGVDEAVELAGTVYLPEVGPPVPLSGAGDVTLGGGLTLTVDPEALDFPSTVDSPWLAGDRLEEAFWPPFAPEGVTLLGVWALAPYDTEVVEEGAPVAVRIDDPLGLAAGDPVRFWVLSYDDGGLIEAAGGAVTGDGAAIETSPADGLTRLTWIAVSAG